MTTRKDDWKLTKFELILNCILTVDLILCFLTYDTKYQEFFKWILLFFFGKFAWPWDFPKQITIFSRKFLNLIWHSTLLTIIMMNQNAFDIKNIDWKIPMLIFIYFNIMRTLGHLIIGMDPAWPTRFSHVGTKSDSKKRIIKSSDLYWTITYLTVEIILGVLYFNRDRFFYST